MTIKSLSSSNFILSIYALFYIMFIESCGKNIMSNNELKLREGNEVELLSDNLLTEARSVIEESNTLHVPVVELSVLGAGVASLIPSLRTVTTDIDAEGLYRVVNKGAGDVLKASKDGTAWGAIKTADGASKMAKLKEVGSISSTTNVPIDPTTMMMAVALYSIEKQLDNISEMQKQILDFLEVEKESTIKADIQMVSKTLTDYKYNWNNTLECSSNHSKMVDIQHKALANINSYKTRIDEIIQKKKLFTVQSDVDKAYASLQKNFRYYQLSIYSYSLASITEIMLSKNFNEKYIQGTKNQIQQFSNEYRTKFTDCSTYLMKMSYKAIDTSAMKELGKAEKVVGNAIGAIPIVNKGTVDEFLLDGGNHLKSKAKKLEQKSVQKFATLSNPRTSMFIDGLDNMNQIYNHTDEICFDSKNIYLINKQQPLALEKEK